MIIHTENYVYPRNYTAHLTIDEDTTIVTANSALRRSLVEGAQSVHESDVSMWKYIANLAINGLLRGCRTLALPLFVGALIFQRVAVDSGFPVADTSGLYHDLDDNVLNIAKATECISQNDPFCLWIFISRR